MRFREALKGSRFSTRSEFLETAEVGAGQFRRYEIGKVSPRWEQIVAWSDLLEVHPGWLAHGAPLGENSGPPSEEQVQQILRAANEGRLRTRIMRSGPSATDLASQIIDARVADQPVDPDVALQLADLLHDSGLFELAERCIQMRDINPEFCAQLGTAIAFRLAGVTSYQAEDDPPADD